MVSRLTAKRLDVIKIYGVLAMRHHLKDVWGRVYKIMHKHKVPMSAICTCQMSGHAKGVFRTKEREWVMTRTGVRSNYK